MLADLPPISLLLWGSATLLTLALVAAMLLSPQRRSYPVFITYLVASIVQTLILIVLYQYYGFNSGYSYRVAWTTQAVVVLARALVTQEVCRLVLGKYIGIWTLAARVLTCCGLLALSLALYFGRNNYHVGTATLEIALEAFISTGIAGLFLFANYYQIRVPLMTANIGLGLGLLSCSRILNDVVFQRFLKISGSTWNNLSSVAFLGVLLLWIWATRQTAPQIAQVPALQSPKLYAEMMPLLNRRLVELNEQLARLCHLEQPKS